MRTTKKNCVLAGLGSVLILAAIYTVSGGFSKTLFRRLIQTPVPKSVSGIEIEANDFFYLSLSAPEHLESTYFMRFSASRQDMEEIVRVGGFRLANNANAAPGGLVPPGAPMWWNQKASMNGLELYTRPGRICGTDYLWIDSNKTAAFYMLWNI